MLSQDFKIQRRSLKRTFIVLLTCEERVGEDNYRIAVFGFGDSREYHPKRLGSKRRSPRRSYGS